MNLSVQAALYGYLLVAFGIYALLPPRTAFWSATLLGWLFLPVAAIDLPLFPAYGKYTAVGYVTLAGALIFHPSVVMSFRPRWFDAPIAFWMLWQAVPNLAMGLGLYDAIHQIFAFFFIWVSPYLMARCYFSGPGHLQEIAEKILLAGAIYVPLFLFELRMSPSLHFWIYGYYPAPFFDMVRMGGYRPVIFMNHGLMLSFMMISCAFLATWIWWQGKLPPILGVGPRLIVGTMLAVALLTRSAGALMIYAVVVGALFISRGAKWRWLLVPLVTLTPAYILARLTGYTDGRFMIDITDSLFSAEYGRSGSLNARLWQEDTTIPIILQASITGWSNRAGGADQMWLILGKTTGLPSVAAWLVTFCLPLLMTLKSDLKKHKDLRTYGLPLGIVLVAWTMDGLFNGMYNPLWVIAAAAVMSAAAPERPYRMTARAPSLNRLAARALAKPNRGAQEQDAGVWAKVSVSNVAPESGHKPWS